MKVKAPLNDLISSFKSLNRNVTVTKNKNLIDTKILKITPTLITTCDNKATKNKKTY